MEKFQVYVPELKKFFDEILIKEALSEEAESKRIFFSKLFENVNTNENYKSETPYSALKNKVITANVEYGNFSNTFSAVYSNDLMTMYSKKDIINVTNNVENETSILRKTSNESKILEESSEDPVPPPLPKTRPPSFAHSEVIGASPVYNNTKNLEEISQEFVPPPLPKSRPPSFINSEVLSTSPVYNNIQKIYHNERLDINSPEAIYENHTEIDSESGEEGTVSWTSEQELESEEEIVNRKSIKLPRRFSGYNSVVENNQCEINGELFLKTKLGHDKYLCALLKDKLLCYKNDKVHKYSECVILKDAEIVVEKKGKKNVINIQPPNAMVFQFHSKDNDKNEEWIQALGRVAKCVKRISEENIKRNESITIYIPMEKEQPVISSSSVSEISSSSENISKLGGEKLKNPTFYEKATNWFAFKPKKGKMKTNTSFDPDVVICGQLNYTQNSEPNAKWTLKWLRVKNNHLEFYENSSEANYEFSLSLYGSIILAAAEETKRPLSFKLKKGKVVLYLEALTTEDLGNWLQVLIKEAHIAKLWEKKTSPPAPLPRIEKEHNSVRELTADFEKLNPKYSSNYILPEEINPRASGNKFVRQAEIANTDDASVYEEAYIQVIDPSESVLDKSPTTPKEENDQVNVIKKLSSLMSDFQSILSSIQQGDDPALLNQQLEQITSKKEDLYTEKLNFSTSKQFPGQKVLKKVTSPTENYYNMIFQMAEPVNKSNSSEISADVEKLSVTSNSSSESNYYNYSSQDPVEEPVKGCVQEKLQLFESIDRRKSFKR